MQIEVELVRRINGVTVLMRRFLAAAAFVVVIGVAGMASAVEMNTLYSVDVVLDPEDPDARDTAYRTALTEVLIRVTGTTAAAESPELAELFPNPASYVLQFRQGPDNTLTVSLDGPSIERVLRQFGATIWGTDRPRTLILLGVDWGQGEREIVAADDPANITVDPRSIDRNRVLRERVEQIADLRGLPIVFPVLDSEDLEALRFTDIWGGFDEELTATAMRYGASSVLVGRIRPDSMLEHRWTWYHDNRRRDWSGEPEQAMNMLGDALAAMYAVGGDAVVDTVRLTISGINSMHDFGEIQRFMDNLKGADKIAVRTAEVGSITYEITIQGGAERLGRALELSGMLDRVGLDSGSSFDSSGVGGNDPFAEPDPAFGQPVALEYIYRSD